MLVWYHRSPTSESRSSGLLPMAPGDLRLRGVGVGTVDVCGLPPIVRLPAVASCSSARAASNLGMPSEIEWRRWRWPPPPPTPPPFGLTGRSSSAGSSEDIEALLRGRPSCTALLAAAAASSCKSSPCLRWPCASAPRPMAPAVPGLWPAPGLRTAGPGACPPPPPVGPTSGSVRGALLSLLSLLLLLLLLLLFLLLLLLL